MINIFAKSSDASISWPGFTTKTAVGSLPANTTIGYGTSLEEVIMRMTGSVRGPVATLSSTIDVNNFLSAYTHDNGYTDSEGHRLSVGDTIKINDGTYNVEWLIAGFDCEKSRKASDNTTYDNGYGIALIPKTYVVNGITWNTNNTLVGAYKSSTMHNSHLPTIATNLRSILGSHLVNRRVLLSNSVDTSSHSNNYEWTTSYLTLMSGAQLGGNIASYNNKYDDGEANYKLPLFSDAESRKAGGSISYWTRGPYGIGGGYFVWIVGGGGEFNHTNAYSTLGVRPFIYIR